jgi:hypothetical protein
MIRFLLLAALGAIFCIVFYIPSRVGPDELTRALLEEHAVVAELWGDDVEDGVHTRAVELQKATARLVLASPSSTPPRTTVRGNAVDSAIVRLFGSTYFQSIDALLALASYRLSCAIELLPALLAFLVAATVDGSVVRTVRSKELVAHSAERYSASLATGLLLGLGVLVAWFLPIMLHPMWVLAALLGMLFALSRALANYHMLR